MHRRQKENGSKRKQKVLRLKLRAPLPAERFPGEMLRKIAATHVGRGDPWGMKRIPWTPPLSKLFSNAWHATRTQSSKRWKHLNVTFQRRVLKLMNQSVKGVKEAFVIGCQRLTSQDRALAFWMS